MSFKEIGWLGTSAAILATLLVTFTFGVYFPLLNHVSINEIGVAYDSSDGKVWVQDQPGWYWTNPFVKVTYVPTVPFQITIPSSAKVINSKMVRFDPSGIGEYLRLQGWGYNMEKEVRNAMLGYAFSGQKFAFLVIIQEPGTETGNLRPSPISSPNGT